MRKVSSEEYNEREFQKARDKKLNEIKRKCDEVTSYLKAPYSETEILTWERQVREAEAFLSGEASGQTTRILKRLAHKRGLTFRGMANKIVAKARNFEDIAAEAVATQQSLEDQVKEATTIEEINAVNWPEDFELPGQGQGQGNNP